MPETYFSHKAISEFMYENHYEIVISPSGYAGHGSTGKYDWAIVLLTRETRPRVMYARGLMDANHAFNAAMTCLDTMMIHRKGYTNVD